MLYNSIINIFCGHNIVYGVEYNVKYNSYTVANCEVIDKVILSLYNNTAVYTC